MSKQQPGYTLIELLISLFLGSILILGFGSLFVQTQKSAVIQRSLSYMMEDGRYLLEVMGRELRRTNSLRSGMSISGNAQIVFVQDNDVLGSGITFNSGDFIKGTPNTVALRYQLNNNTELAITDPNSTNSICERNLLLMNGEDPASQTHVVTLYFYVALDSANIPVLYCNAKRVNFSGVPITTVISSAEPLISNVQQLLISYGIDTDADNSPNYFISGTTGISTISSTEWQQVRAVKLSVVLRSDADNLATTTATDKRLYRVFSTTIAFRN
jgi:type IV pilus assembly protein PilW